jgi:hypothetical protein
VVFADTAYVKTHRLDASGHATLCARGGLRVCYQVCQNTKRTMTMRRYDQRCDITRPSASTSRMPLPNSLDRMKNRWQVHPEGVHTSTESQFIHHDQPGVWLLVVGEQLPGKDLF